MEENRVTRYWSKRAHDFGMIRKNELENEMSERWVEVFDTLLPKKEGMKILDVGTGTGFFPVLFSERGHFVCGIDLTHEMIVEAKALAKERKVDPVFLEMDAQKLEFPDESFDAVISRNLTWTLPNPEEAYKEWFRVLRPGGVFLNFDANYGCQVRSDNRQNMGVPSDSPYGHIGITEEMERENAEITLSMEINSKHRPEWDRTVMEQIGFVDVACDLGFGKKVLKNHDLKNAPMFRIRALKR